MFGALVLVVLNHSYALWRSVSRRSFWVTRLAAAAALAASFGLPAIASAGLCGDDVAGVRVACSCGDFVVSDTMLVATDPVVTDRCPTDGLVVQAAEGTDSLTLDLGGLSITGSGVGVGLLVSNGGSDGAVISGGPDSIRPGQVVGFGDGLRVRTQRALSELANVDFRGNTGDGVAIRSYETKVTAVRAFANGRDGIRISGRKATLDTLESDGNGRFQLNMETSSAAQAALDGAITQGVHARERLPNRREPVPMGEQ